MSLKGHATPRSHSEDSTTTDLHKAATQSSPAVADTRPISYGPANPHPLSTLKTELVWEGKYDEYGNRREVDAAGLAMPLQKIETVDEPRARTEAQGGLFDASKSHLDDFRNMLVWGDNKLVIASLLKDFRGRVDLIYIDPPFDVGADFTLDVPIGEQTETIDKEQSALEMVAYRDTWGRGTDSYLHFISERLLLARDLLSENGSIYVHCDGRVNSHIRAILDETFGRDYYRNEIIWKRTGARSGTDGYNIIHDSLLFYSQSDLITWNTQYTPYSDKYLDDFFRYADSGGRRYRLTILTAPGKRKGASGEQWRGYNPTTKGRHWAIPQFVRPLLSVPNTDTQAALDELDRMGRIAWPKKEGGVPSFKQYVDEFQGVELQSIWSDISPVSAQANERADYSTQKPEALLERILTASSNQGDLVADFFCGSGTTGAVAEKLGRRWLMADLGRFAIHTSRKRLIEVQRGLHAAGKPYRAFDVFNLGRYERQWWQKETLKGADEDHRRVVLEFYKAEPLKSAPSSLLHGRKGATLCHVDGIDSVFSRSEAKAVADAATQAGAKDVACLAWEFEMDLRMVCNSLEKELGIKIKLIQIPREIMEKNRKEPPPFLEVATLEATPILHTHDGKRAVDIKLMRFIPSLAEVPTKELEALQERAVKSGFDFIDFWAIDFDFKNGGPFNHHWQDYRTRKDRSLRSVSEQHYVYPKKGRYTACVKVVDIFGCDTSVTVEIVYG